MALLLNDEQTMLRDNARSFLAKNAPVAHLRKLRDDRDRDGFSRALWKEFANLGWSGILVPPELGGLGLGHVEVGVVMEECGRTLTPSPLLSTAVVGATAIARGGSDAQKKAYLPRIAHGDLIATLAIDETTKHRPEKTALKASKTGSGFALNGAKSFVLDGHVAELLIVAGRTSGEPGQAQGITLFLVDAKIKGLELERTVMVDAHNSARLTFENVVLPADSVLGEVGSGWSTLEGALNVGRAAAAAELFGAGEEAFAKTVTYLKERKQFGKIIGQFQALQHRAANVYCELEVTRSVVLRALQALDESIDSAGALVSAAKARAGTSAGLAVQEAVQMHGGIGMTDEFDVGFYMKRVRALQELWGDANFHADRLARLNHY